MLPIIVGVVFVSALSYVGRKLYKEEQAEKERKRKEDERTCHCCIKRFPSKAVCQCEECGELTCTDCRQYSDSVDYQCQSLDQELVQIVEHKLVCAKCLPKVNAVMAEQQKTFDNAQVGETVKYYPINYGGNPKIRLNEKIESGWYKNQECCVAELKWIAFQKGCYVVRDGIKIKKSDSQDGYYIENEFKFQAVI